MKRLLLSLILFTIPVHAATRSTWYLQSFDTHGKKVSYSTKGVGSIPLWVNVPQSPAGITMLTSPVTTDLTGKQWLIISFQMLSLGSPVYQTNLQPDNTCFYPNGYPAIIVPFLWRTGSIDNQFSRWWARDYQLTIQPNGVYQIAVPMIPSAWMSVFGIFGNDALLEYQDALRNIYQVGVTFGGGCYLSHGVNIQAGTGQTTIYLTGYEFQ